MTDLTCKEKLMGERGKEREGGMRGGVGGVPLEKEVLSELSRKEGWEEWEDGSHDIHSPYSILLFLLTPPRATVIKARPSQCFTF